MELALEEHLAVLSDTFTIKEQVKRQYVIKCVEDIREVFQCMMWTLLLIYACVFQMQPQIFYENFNIVIGCCNPANEESTLG